MNEKWLHHLWMYKLYRTASLKTTDGKPLEILHHGEYNTNAGPDFLMAKIKCDELLLAGHIELHLKSSDWDKHGHSTDPNYHPVILHVVYEHDVHLPYFQQKNIPTLELKNYLPPELVRTYNSLQNNFKFVPCEKFSIPQFFSPLLYEKLLLEKLENKCREYEERLKLTQNHWEQLVFEELAYAFGLKINAPNFRQLAENIDFSVLQKIRYKQEALEALFFGATGLIETPKDDYMLYLQREYAFLKNKFGLKIPQQSVLFLRLRPHNFPTLRLSQLAHLYYKEPHLFSKIKESKNLAELLHLFQDIHASEYWKNHFVFGKTVSKSSTKYLSKNFKTLLLLNTILPLYYFIHRSFEEEILDKVLDFYRELAPENNALLSRWNNLGITPQNALESQALLWLYGGFCKEKKCLNCSIGYQLLKSK